MALQTSYTQTQRVGYPGELVDMSEWDATTKTATGPIAFGAPVQRVPGGRCAALAGGEYIGVACATHATSVSTDGYPTGDSFVETDNVPVVNEGKLGGLEAVMNL